MDTNLLILITLVCFLGCLVYIGYSVFFNRKSTQFDNLMRASRGGKGIALEVRKRINEDETGEEFERLRDSHRKSFEKFGKQQISEEERMFHAGLFSQGQQQAFKNFRKFGPTALAVGVAILLYTMMGQAIFMVYGALIGMLAGLSVPGFYLDRKIKKRSEEIMFYLPLVIEQLAIGVSSSLDIGPCIQNVVQMADERDSHNVVTELFRHCEYYVKSGVSLEEALSEIGKKSGHTELKHAFLALSQVARHGGEISRQLQELADATSKQRETQIEGKIKRLELVATGPVALVFFGFIVILLIGFGIQIQESF